MKPYLILIFFLIFSPFQKMEITVDNNINLKRNHLIGKFKASEDSSFVKIAGSYTSKSNIYMEKESYSAFIKMYNSAAIDGVNLNIISAFRSFYHQKWIWERKWNGERKVNGERLNEKHKDEVERAKIILRYSSMPGTSRHHWGTDIDIYSLNNKAFDSGEGLKIYNWLTENASKFGFYQAYTPFDEKRKTGYLEEKWHWSYKPIAVLFINEYKNKIKESDIQGFDGSETASKINIIDDYVMGINPILKAN